MTSSLKRTFLTLPAIGADIILFFLFTQQFQLTCNSTSRINLRTNKRQNTREEPRKAILFSSFSLLALDGESRLNMTRWKVITPRHGAGSLTFPLSSFAWEKTFLSHLQWKRQHQQRFTAPTGTIWFGWFVCAFFKELLHPINNLPKTAPLPLSVHACTPTNTDDYLQLCSVAVYVFVNGSAWQTFEMTLLSIQISKGKLPVKSDRKTCSCTGWEMDGSIRDRYLGLSGHAKIWPGEAT